MGQGTGSHSAGALFPVRSNTWAPGVQAAAAQAGAATHASPTICRSTAASSPGGLPTWAQRATTCRGAHACSADLRAVCQCASRRWLRRPLSGNASTYADAATSGNEGRAARRTAAARVPTAASVCARRWLRRWGSVVGSALERLRRRLQQWPQQRLLQRLRRCGQHAAGARARRRLRPAALRA